MHGSEHGEQFPLSFRLRFDATVNLNRAIAQRRRAGERAVRADASLISWPVLFSHITSPIENIEEAKKAGFTIYGHGVERRLARLGNKSAATNRSLCAIIAGPAN